VTVAVANKTANTWTLASSMAQTLYVFSTAQSISPNTMSLPLQAGAPVTITLNAGTTLQASSTTNATMPTTWCVVLATTSATSSTSSKTKLIIGLVVGLAILAAAIAGYYAYRRSKNQTNSESAAQGEVASAQAVAPTRKWSF